MDQNKVLGYFEQLCNSYYIAYKERSRIKGEITKLEKVNPYEQLVIVRQLIRLNMTEEMRKKYCLANFSKDTLRVEESRLNIEYKEYNEKMQQLEAEQAFWRQRTSNLDEEICEIVEIIRKYGYSITIHSDKEAVVLIQYFYKHSKIYKVVDMEKSHIREGTTENEICNKFIQACENKDGKVIEELHKKYL